MASVMRSRHPAAKILSRGFILFLPVYFIDRSKFFSPSAAFLALVIAGLSPFSASGTNHFVVVI